MREIRDFYTEEDRQFVESFEHDVYTKGYRNIESSTIDKLKDISDRAFNAYTESYYGDEESLKAEIIEYINSFSIENYEAFHYSLLDAVFNAEPNAKDLISDPYNSCGLWLRGNISTRERALKTLLDNDPERLNNYIAEIIRTISNKTNNLVYEYKQRTSESRSESVPPTSVLLHDPLSYKTFQNELPSDNQDNKIVFKPNRKDPKLDVYFNACLMSEPDNTVYGVFSREFSDYDKQVLEAVCSLWLNKQYRFTLTQLYKTMVKDKDQRPTDKQSEKLKESMLKMMTTLVFLDTGNIGNMYKFQRYKRLQHVIEARATSEYTHNQYGDQYDLIFEISSDFPPLNYDFANRLKMVDTYPLDDRRIYSISNTKQQIELKAFLEYRILGMQGTPKSSKDTRVILMDSLYNECYDFTNLKPDSVRQKKKRIRDQMESILDEYKSKGTIKDYKFNKSGNIIKKVTIAMK